MQRESAEAGDALISVIIPTYNRAYCLRRTIESVQRQTYRRWEILLIDDGSTDDTADLAISMAAADARIIYYRQDNAGVSAARNTGMDRSRGDFIAFLDSDDSWHPFKLQVQLAVLRALPEVGMIWSDMLAVDDRGAVLAQRYMRTMYGAYSHVSPEKMFHHTAPLSRFTSTPEGLTDTPVFWGDVFSAILFGNLVHTSTVLIRRERALSAGQFDRSFRSGEDYDFHLRICAEGEVAFLDMGTINYRIQGGADQLTAEQYNVDIARNALQAREKACARHRERVLLSGRELKRIFAGATGRVATALFDVDAFAEARPYFWRSLRLSPYQPKLLAKAALSTIPATVVRPLLRGYRRMRRR